MHGPPNKKGPPRRRNGTGQQTVSTINSTTHCQDCHFLPPSLRPTLHQNLSLEDRNRLSDLKRKVSNAINIGDLTRAFYFTEMAVTVVREGGGQ